MLNTQNLTEKRMEQNTSNVICPPCRLDEIDEKSKETVEDSAVEKAMPSINFDYKQIIVPDAGENMFLRKTRDEDVRVHKNEAIDKSNEVFYRNISIVGWVAFAFVFATFFIIIQQS